jgi:tyrosyl-tRNA synthetase
LFSGDLQGLSAETLGEVATSISEKPADVSASGSAATLVAVLVHSGLVASNREAREHLQSGAISINGWKPTQDCPVADVVGKAVHGWLIMRRGKKTVVAARVVQ